MPVHEIEDLRESLVISGNSLVDLLPEHHLAFTQLATSPIFHDFDRIVDLVFQDGRIILRSRARPFGLPDWPFLNCEWRGGLRYPTL